MKLSHRYENETCIVTIIGNLALNGADKVQEYLQLLTQQNTVKKILLNCMNVSVIDSRGIGLLARILQGLEGKQEGLALCSLNENCLNLLKALRLDKIIAIHESEEHALSDLKNISHSN